MQPQSDAEYRQLLTDVIKKQIVILGPDITLIKARNVAGLTVDDQGNVTTISGEPQQITQALIDQFVQLSGLIVKKTMEPLLMYHTADGAQTGAPSSPAPAVASPVPVPAPAPVSPVVSSPVAPMPSQTPIATAQSVTPPMPNGTQPITSTPVLQNNAPVSSSTPVSPIPASPVPQTPAASEIDTETQKIINDALQQT